MYECVFCKMEYSIWWTYVKSNGNQCWFSSWKSSKLNTRKPLDIDGYVCSAVENENYLYQTHTEKEKEREKAIYHMHIIWWMAFSSFQEPYRQCLPTFTYGKLSACFNQA